MATPITSIRATEVHCIACDYNLRGLDPAGRCPECGHSVADSVVQFELLRENPYSFAAADLFWRRSFQIALWLLAIITLQGLIRSSIWSLSAYAEWAVSPLGARVETALAWMVLAMVSIAAFPVLFYAALVMTGSKRRNS